MSFNTVTTVTAAADSVDLVDLAIVKDELGIADADTSSDTQLGRYITAASAAAAQYCNRVFVVETVKDVIDLQRDPYPWQLAGGVAALQASRWPITTLTSVVELDDTLVVDTDFRADLARGVLYRLSPFDGSVIAWPARPVTLAYAAGYATIPPDVQDAVIRMIRSRWFAKDRDPMIRQVNVPGVVEKQFWVPTGTDAGNLTPDVADVLDNYRVPVAF
jgi:hypothetical protein